jgi:hypothetical protein
MTYVGAYFFLIRATCSCSLHATLALHSQWRTEGGFGG